mmetsp:Transcript_3093/g.8761  ORF Transcript_3093/g.8761 Transcript_3093/m.8761 type:complete len:372 (-) Transcript_3093:49-1164(-)
MTTIQNASRKRIGGQPTWQSNFNAKLVFVLLLVGLYLLHSSYVPPSAGFSKLDAEVAKPPPSSSSRLRSVPSTITVSEPGRTTNAKDICLNRSFQRLCSAYEEDATMEKCLQSPRSFFSDRYKGYTPSATELEARKLMTSVSALSIGAGPKKSGLCNHATIDSKTLCTDRPQLDLFFFESWLSLTHSSSRGIRVVFAEHVLEHFDPIQVERVAAAAFAMMRPGGTFRVAVPDGYKPSPNYQQYIRAGGTSSGHGQKHMVAWTVDNLCPIFASVGFDIKPRENYNFKGEFFSAKDAYKDDETIGKIKRSMLHDKRNVANYNGTVGNSMGTLRYDDLQKAEHPYTSLWFDAVKPSTCTSHMSGLGLASKEARK